MINYIIWKIMIGLFEVTNLERKVNQHVENPHDEYSNWGGNLSNLRWCILKTLLKTFCCLLALFWAFLSLTFVDKDALADAFTKRAKFSFPLLVWIKSVPPDFYNCYLLDFSAIEWSGLFGLFLNKKKNMIYF